MIGAIGYKGIDPADYEWQINFMRNTVYEFIKARTITAEVNPVVFPLGNTHYAGRKQAGTPVVICKQTAVVLVYSRAIGSNPYITFSIFIKLIYFFICEAVLLDILNPFVFF